MVQAPAGGPARHRAPLVRIASSVRLARARASASVNRSSPVVSTVALIRMASSAVTFDGTFARTGGSGSVRIS